MDATAQAELVSSGQVLPRELVDAAIERVEKLNGELNAMVTTLFERARAAAVGDLPEGPLPGVPFLLKDRGALSEGDPYAEGVKAARTAGYRADHDSVITERVGYGNAFMQLVGTRAGDRRAGRVGGPGLAGGR